MSGEAAPAPASTGGAYSARAILATVLVSIVAFAGLAVLAAYAPELRKADDGRAHALSKSAIGYAGAPILLKGLGVPVVVSRTRLLRPTEAVLVLTPAAELEAEELAKMPGAPTTLIVLPKWQVMADPIRKGAVRKVRAAPDGNAFEELLSGYAKTSHILHRDGWARPVLTSRRPVFQEGRRIGLGRIDHLQTLYGDGWTPALVDEGGNAVLAVSVTHPNVWVLADPDLLNNQGLASRDNARALADIVDAARRGQNRPVMFDVTLNGLARGKGLGRLLLEPPWLAATLCAVAAAVLMGLHALARFGQPRREARAFALGAGALVDNSAGLVRMARREHELAPAYAALMQARLGAGGAGHDPGWLEEMARRRGAASPAALAAEAEAAKTRGDLTEVARKLYDWKTEMTRGRG